jgi:hypothetical protein
MWRLSIWLVTAVTLLMGFGCAINNPFKISRDDFYGKVKIIALAPVDVPTDLEDPEPVKAKFESMIVAKLHDGGFTVVPPKETADLFAQAGKELGALPGAETGAVDDAQAKAIRQQLRQALSSKYHADAVLYPAIEVVRAAWYGNAAGWDHVTEQIQSTAEQLKEAPPFALFGFAVTQSGSVGALSLVVVVDDMNGVETYVNRGGIQVLAKRSGSQFVAVPRASLFSDEKRNAAAIEIAVGPLGTKRSS